MRSESDNLWQKGKELGALPPEIDDEGNIEYKLKLSNPTSDRLDHLTTQMKWRLSEGSGEALYEIGVDDDGTFVGISAEEMKASILNLKTMAASLGATVSIVREVVLDAPTRYINEVLVCRQPTDDGQPFTDIRVAIIGADDAGKSTLLGFLTHGEQDNGRGRARLSMLRHRHEIESGRTSSIAHEIIGYDNEGHLVNYAATNVHTWEQICEQSRKIITFLDTCGHAKYIRTTIGCLTGDALDYACLVIPATLGTLSDMSREHLSLAVMLDIPVFVVLTKIDIATEKQIGDTLQALQALLASGIRKEPIVVDGGDKLMSCATHLARRGPWIPVFLISSVTGAYAEHLYQFFNLLPKNTIHSERVAKEPAEFEIDQVFSLPDVGTVVGGILRRGKITLEDGDQGQYPFQLGPDTDGNFTKAALVSIQRHRVPVRSIACGQAAALAIDAPNLDKLRLKRGMVLLQSESAESYMEFEADVIVLYHPVGLMSGMSATMHTGSVHQEIRIVSIWGGNGDGGMGLDPLTSASDPAVTLLSGQRGRCRLRFMHSPEYLREDAQILCIQEKSKWIGRITRLVNQKL